MLDGDLFAKPSVSYRPIPFWFWNGEMKETELQRQIEEMADKGVGGFFICPRQGLQVPYLSALWFDTVRKAVEMAETRGLQVWLYDEFPYPSGVSGGEVLLRHPEAKHRKLIHRTVSITGTGEVNLELPWAKVLKAMAVPYDTDLGDYVWENSEDLANYIGSVQVENISQKVGLTAYNQKRYFTYGTQKRLHWRVPAGTWKIVVLMEEEIKDFKYYGNYVDPCNEEAVRTFLRTTHERYADTLGEHFGHSVKGFFTDETGMKGDIPWSPWFLDFFQQRNGYDLIDQLQSLLYSTGEKTSQVRYDFFQTMHLHFRQSYHLQVSEWCERHGLQYAAEVPSMRMSTQLYSHIPGGDSGHEKLGRPLAWILDHYAYSLRYNPKMISSLARQSGRKRALIECFHSVGWSMTLQDAKWMIDRMAAMGINLFNFHAFFYTLDGLTKYDAPPSQFLQNPYWEHFHLLSDYVGRVSYAMSQGKAAIHIAVLDPTTSFWTHLGNPFYDFKYVGMETEERRKLETLKQDWAHICTSLSLNHLDYDHLDPEILSGARIEEGALELGDARYSVLIIPPVTNLESGAWDTIKVFIQAGGTVIGMGLLGYERIDAGRNVEAEMLEWFGLTDSTKTQYWRSDENDHVAMGAWHRGKKSTYFLPSTGSLKAADAGKDLVELLQKIVPTSMKLEPVTGDLQSLLVHHRILEDESHLVFIANQENDNIELFMALDYFQENQMIEQLDLESGESSWLPVERFPDARVYLQFAPYQSRLLRIHRPLSDQEHLIKPKETDPSWVVTLETIHTWQISGMQPNVLRFGMFHFSLDVTKQGMKEHWHLGNNEGWPTVEPKTLIDQMDDVKERVRLPIDFLQHFGIPMKPRLQYPLDCWYQTTFEIVDIPEDGYLLMDKHAISGGYAIYLNGHRLVEQDFQPMFRYDHQNYGCPVSSLLHVGRNTLVIHVIAEQDWDGLNDPIYLTGSFGVYFGKEAELIIGEIPQSTTLHGGIYNGYPYYSGTLSLKSSVDIYRIEQPEFSVHFPDWDSQFHDCAEVLINGQTLGVRAWTPYNWGGASEILKIGENTIEVKVTNTLASMLEGKYFDYEKHQLKDVRDFDKQ